MSSWKPREYKDTREDLPEVIFYGSETASCVSSRGVYHFPVEKYKIHDALQITSYDIIGPPWAYPPDLEFQAVDKTMIHFEIEGNGSIAAVGNGNAATTEPFQANYRKAFNGLCMVFVKSTGDPGTIRLTAHSECLDGSSISLITK